MIPATSVFVNGEEKLGFILYGIWPKSLSAQPPAVPVVEVPGAEFRTFVLYGDSWYIIGIELGFDDGAQYRSAVDGVETLLRTVLANGAQVSWIGSEGLPFADPPDLFTAEEMEGGVLAARTVDGTSFSGIMSGGFTPLTNEQMATLERSARGVYR